MLKNKDKHARNLINNITKYTNFIPKAHHDFSNKSNGVPIVTDSGQPIHIFNNGLNVSGLTVLDGNLTHGNPTGNNGAGYLEVSLNSQITRMGMVVNFPSTNAGSAVFASFEKSIVAEHLAGRAIPSAGIHVKIDKTKVEVIIYRTGGGSTAMGIYVFPTPLSANTNYTFQMIRDNKTIYIVLPDGTITPPYTHDDVALLTSKYACIELFEINSSINPASIVKFWADDEIVDPKSNIATTFDMAKLVSKQPEPINHTIDKTTTTTTTLTTNYQTILTVSIPTPASKKALVIASAYGNITGAGLMFYRASVQANLTYGFEEAVGSTVNDGMKTIFGVITFPTNVGVVTDVTLEAKMISGTGTVTNNNSTGRPVSMTIIPIL